MTMGCSSCITTFALASCPYKTYIIYIKGHMLYNNKDIKDKGFSGVI